MLKEQKQNSIRKYLFLQAVCVFTEPTVSAAWRGRGGAPMKNKKPCSILGGCLLVLTTVLARWLLAAPAVGTNASLYEQRAFVPYLLLYLLMAVGLYLLGLLREDEAPANLLPALVLGLLLLPLNKQPFFGGYYGGNALPVGLTALSPLGLCLWACFLLMFVLGAVWQKGLGRFDLSRAAALFSVLLLALLETAARDGLMGYMLHSSMGRLPANRYLIWTLTLLPLLYAPALLLIIKKESCQGWWLAGLGGAMTIISLVFLYVPGVLGILGGIGNYLFQTEARSLYLGLLLAGLCCLLARKGKTT